ncbi:hypothetical protein SNEBB_009531 [Seison nebaliae]|nr:hypothetical protein SNEBB_009531 [Seison nebaliae]
MANLTHLLDRPQRFTHPEWRRTNKDKHLMSEIDRRNAELLCATSEQTDLASIEVNTKNVNDVNQQLDVRIDDIDYWKKELERKLDDLKKETDYLLTYKNRLIHSVDDLVEPMKITRLCLSEREKRTDIDLVHDEVQMNLLKEETINDGCKNLLEKTLSDVEEQLRLNRKYIYQLEQDIKGKEKSKNIDEYTKELSEENSNLQFHSDEIKRTSSNALTPNEWKELSNQLIIKAENTRSQSEQLRRIAQQIIEQTTNDINSQIHKTNVAFENRIFEEKLAKAKLEDQIKEVDQQIRNLEEVEKLLDGSIRKRFSEIKLTHTRLDSRNDRKDAELCADPAHFALLKQLAENECNLERLQSLVMNAEKQLRKLKADRLMLYQDLATKTNTIHIDEATCLEGFRKSLKIRHQ